MAQAVDFAYGADVPLAVDANMSKVVTFETRLVVARMVARKRSIDWYAMNGSCSINFMMEFSALEGQLNLGGERRGGSGWKRLGVGGRSQFFDVSF